MKTVARRRARATIPLYPYTQIHCSHQLPALCTLASKLSPEKNPDYCHCRGDMTTAAMPPLISIINLSEQLVGNLLGNTDRNTWVVERYTWRLD